MSSFLRRMDINLMTPIELEIRSARLAVEGGPAHPLMTDASVLLGQAQEKVADYVDLVNEGRSPTAEAKDGEDRMLKWFAYAHLPPQFQTVSRPFFQLATLMCTALQPGPERTAGLRKLLEAKDCAVRALVQPGG